MQTELKKFLSFYFLTLVLSWGIWSLHFFYSPNPLWHALGSLGPALAGLIVFPFHFRNSKKLSPSFAKTFVWILVPPGIFAASALYLSLRHSAPVDFSLVGVSEEFNGQPVWVYWLVSLFCFGFGEELGWRRALMPLLEERLGLRKAAFVFVFFWALWHLPLFWITPGYRSMDFASIMGWLASLIAGSLILQRVYHSTNSLVAVSLFHGGMDIFFNSRSPEGVMTIMGAVTTLLGVALLVKNKNPLKNSGS